MKRKIGFEAKANGKINLFLDVISKSNNGFHEIKSIMQCVSLCDKLLISATRSAKCDVRLSCNLPYIPCDERNIAHKAAMLFFKKSGICAEADIAINKRIPVSGGMAGGSTDAAAVLKALNRLFGGTLSSNELYKAAAELGSDVPFCLSGKTALCEGRGEIITPIENKANLFLLIVPSSENVSTPWAYSKLDEVFGDFSGRDSEAKYQALREALATGNIHGVANNMYNIFEEVILPERPIAMRAKELMLESGALGAMMSGSGPTTFGIFENEESRNAAMKNLSKNGYRPKSAESIL